MYRLKAYRIVPIVVVMVEAKAVVDDKEKRKKSKEETGGKRKWTAIGAVAVLVVAIAITSKHAQNHKSCHCSQVLFFFLSIFLVISFGVIELLFPVC